jgi:hypothetical protein
MTRQIRKKNLERQAARSEARAVGVTVGATGTVAQVLGPVPFTISVPSGAVLLDLIINLSLLVPRLQSFPPATVRFILNGTWTGEADHFRPLCAGDVVTLASEAQPRDEVTASS